MRNPAHSLSADGQLARLHELAREYRALHTQAAIYATPGLLASPLDEFMASKLADQAAEQLRALAPLTLALAAGGDPFAPADQTARWAAAAHLLEQGLRALIVAPALVDDQLVHPDQVVTLLRNRA